ncbi:hypothetical protein [uncultured Alistipes sp.]|uniref:hypothetical protein n=1 Tax=uncultured Alistipes sp. TaxID=538949 RepID=UPI002632BBE0|nr:hypothetical protein [uncultured Alistipes sp.]
MEVKKLMDELDRLRAIVAGWQHVVAVERIERDMALDKLKALYEDISFGSRTVSENVAPQGAAAAGAAAETPAAAECPPESEKVPAAPVAPEAHGAVPPAAASVAQPVAVQTVAEQVCSAPAAAVPAAGRIEVAPLAGAEIPSVGAAGTPEALVPGTGTAQAPCPAPVGEEAPVPVPDTDFGTEAGTPSLSASAFEQKLFDDERMTRIRMDKQVILSLYGDAPVAPVVAAPSAPVPSPAPAVPVGEPRPLEEAYENIPMPSAAVSAAEGHRKVLGEVIVPGGEAMNDVLGRQTAHEDVASRLQSRGLTGDLRHSIGINDRFMLIRNLFDGDSEAYADMIARLDAFADLDEALLFLQENYRWDPDNEGLQLLVDLLERKLG